MAENIESFVAKLQAEGVEAGQKEAQKIKERAEKEASEITAQAKTQAEQIIAQAEQDGDKILADAKAQADSMLARGRTELELASRDAAGKLREALGRAVRAVLAAGAKATLDDEAFVGQALHEIITQYTQAELESRETFRINVPEQMRQKLVDWALAHIGSDSLQGGHVTIDLQGTLAQAGFEYNATGATVEVTVDSVVEVLASLVSPALRDIINQAMSENEG